MRDFFWQVLKWFFFRLDAESVHRFTVSLIRLGMKLGGTPLRWMSGARKKALAITLGHPQGALGSDGESRDGSVRVWNMEFSSRLGLAAGFDKDGEILGGLPELGFGFAEIGTVTPRPQPGNDAPRLFREPGRLAIFNRMGFNGLGASLISERVAEAKPTLPHGFRVGINLGKNKDTPNEKAAHDYALAAQAFEDLADYLVINVSSPNTPGLRALQSVEMLRPIIARVQETIAPWRMRPPILLKLAPEVKGDDLKAIIEAAESWGVEGWVLTNTLAGTIELRPDEAEGKPRSLPGGWSGAPLTESSRSSLIEARRLTRLPIISVGGILTPEEAAYRIRSGAALVQVYTGWVFGGPGFPMKVARELAAVRLDSGSAPS